LNSIENGYLIQIVFFVKATVIFRPSIRLLFGAQFPALVVCFSEATPTSIGLFILYWAFSSFSSLILFALPKKYPKTLDKKMLLPAGSMRGPLFCLAYDLLCLGFVFRPCCVF
jgi:hypothetical protein